MTPPRKRRGGPPRYTEATAQARREGDLRIRLLPEEAQAFRAWAEECGGLAALVRHLLRERSDRPAPVEAWLHELLQGGPILLTTDGAEDVIVRLLRGPVPPLSVAAQGAGPGLEEALAGLRLRTK